MRPRRRRSVEFGDTLPYRATASAIIVPPCRIIVPCYGAPGADNADNDKVMRTFANLQKRNV
jgi:hypothetical protein